MYESLLAEPILHAQQPPLGNTCLLKPYIVLGR